MPLWDYRSKLKQLSNPLLLHILRSTARNALFYCSFAYCKIMADCWSWCSCKIFVPLTKPWGNYCLCVGQMITGDSYSLCCSKNLCICLLGWPHFHTYTALRVHADTGVRPASNHGLFLLFAWWNLHTASLSLSALFLPYFHLVAPWNWFLPASVVAFVSNAQAGEREKERDGRPYFSFKEGFTLLPRRRLFELTPFGFWTRTKRNVGTNASGSVWLVWLEDAEETGSLQPTESIHQQKTSPH